MSPWPFSPNLRHHVHAVILSPPFQLRNASSSAKIYLESIHCWHFGSTLIPSCLLIMLLSPFASVLHTSHEDCFSKKEVGACRFPASQFPHRLRPECREHLGGPAGPGSHPILQLHLPPLSLSLSLQTPVSPLRSLNEPSSGPPHAALPISWVLPPLVEPPSLGPSGCSLNATINQASRDHRSQNRYHLSHLIVPSSF